MFKIYICETKKKTDNLMSDKRGGYFKSNEKFLLYQNGKGNWVATTPYNSTLKENTFLVKQRFDTKGSIFTDLEYMKVIDMAHLQDKKSAMEYVLKFKTKAE